MVKLPQFLKEELQCKKSMKVLALRLNPAGVPTRHCLRCSIEQLSDIASLDTTPLLDPL
jgi:hypothetical protein